MSNDDLVVTYKGVPKFRLNARLVAQKNLSSDDVEWIKKFHVDRLGIEEVMENASHKDLKGLYALWYDNQRTLQEAWKFPLNDNFIRFWNVPQCTCPKMDNEDAYPTGYYTVNSSCPVHGG